MKRLFDLEAARAAESPSNGRVATIGFFDGVHRGHVRILDAVTAWAAEAGAESAVVTFDCHPQSVLGGHPPVPVVSLEHRLLLLERCGVDATLVLPFDRELASQSPEGFYRSVLEGALDARRLVFGFDSAFGHRREGTYEYIADRPETFRAELRRVEAEWLGGERVSSTRIRKLIARGELGEAAECLGRSVSILGRVVRGDARGRTIGFPTANLDLCDGAVLPRGVYFARAIRWDAELRGAGSERGGSANAPRAIPALVNVGRAPTFRDDASADEPDRVEVHLLDFEGDLYGEWLEVEIEARHRDELRFDGADALAAQLRRDVAARRRLEDECRR